MNNYDDLIAAGRAKLWDGRLEEAQHCFDAALRQRSQEAVPHYLRGESFFLRRRLDEALRCPAAALSCGMDRDIGARGRAMSGVVPGDFGWMCHMLRGDFESAWRLADRDRSGRDAHRRVR